MVTGLRRDGVIEQFEICLQSLRVSSVDILYLNWPDHENPIEETLSAVQELYKSSFAMYVSENAIVILFQWENSRNLV